MAKAYTISSDPFYVNGSITESAADTFTQTEISLPLDSLNREGVLVHAVYFTSSEPTANLGLQTAVSVQVTTTSQTGLVGANSANLLAKRESIITGGAAEFSGPHIHDFVGDSAPYQVSDNLGIVATDNVFLGIKGNNNGTVKNAQMRMVCSRIKLSADAYAALVTNELSS